MSESYTWDDAGQNNADPEPRPRDLRDQIKSLAEKLKERDDLVAKMNTQLRAQAIGSVLSGMDIPPEVAELVPSSVEPTADAVKTWAEKFAPLFVKREGSEGKQEGGAEPQNEGAQAKNVNPPPNATPEEIDAWRRIQTAEASAGSTTPDIEAQQLNMLTSAYSAAKGSSDRYFEILRGDRQIPTT